MHTIFSGVIPQEPNENVIRRVLAHSENLMMVHITFRKKSGDAGFHRHPHEQITYVDSGKVEYFIKGKGTIMSPGDSIYVSPNVEHGLKPLEDNCVVLDAFTPQRDDFLGK
ncbi:MAG: cupin domain-containing protein [Oscillospiraceae bacterium]|nr:cupin domain-containing protein [Oscillospiraceae bacterium]